MPNPDPAVQFIPAVSGLCPAPGYSYAAVAPADLVFVSGQVALDANGALVGKGDFAAQTRQVLANLRLVLEAAGSSPSAVLKVNYYVVGLTRERLATIRELRNAFFSDPKPASTLVGVEMLFDPEALIEIEVVAARKR